MTPHAPIASINKDVAARYDDELHGDEDAAAAFLAELAGEDSALEFAIGTGRIALSLADADVAVDGIELSEAMVDRLREKPGGQRSHRHSRRYDVGFDGLYLSTCGSGVQRHLQYSDAGRPNRVVPQCGKAPH